VEKSSGHVQVIAVSGLPGAGKTTLSRALARTLRAGHLFHYDDYETVTKRPPAEIQAWMSRGADPDEINLDRLVTDLAKAKALMPPSGEGAYIVLDTLLGRSHRETAKLIDHSVWIDLPANLALARQIGAQAAIALHAGDPSVPQKFTAWLAGFLKNYETFVHDAYELQLARVRQQADLSVDGRAPVERIVAAVIAGIEDRARRPKAATSP
jgi:uridine kinase